MEAPAAPKGVARSPQALASRWAHVARRHPLAGTAPPPRPPRARRGGSQGLPRLSLWRLPSSNAKSFLHRSFEIPSGVTSSLLPQEGWPDREHARALAAPSRSGHLGYPPLVFDQQHARARTRSLACFSMRRQEAWSIHAQLRRPEGHQRGRGTCHSSLDAVRVVVTAPEDRESWSPAGG